MAGPFFVDSGIGFGHPAAGHLRPATIFEGIHKQNAADAPSNRIGGENHGNIRNEMDHDGNVYDTEHTPNGKHYDHGRHRLA